MIEQLDLRTEENDTLRIHPARDVDDSLSGVALELLEDDRDYLAYKWGTILGREAALALAMAMANIATQGLSPDDVVSLHSRVSDRLMGGLRPARKPSCIIPFPAPASRVSYPFPAAGDPADADTTTSASVGMVGPLPVDSGQLTAEAPRS